MMLNDAPSTVQLESRSSGNVSFGAAGACPHDRAYLDESRVPAQILQGSNFEHNKH
jgi:hypothetical protein